MKINKAAMKAAAEDAVKGLRESILQRIIELEGATLTIGAPTTHDTTALANDVLALKESYNSLSPVFRLPPEILSRVFIILELSSGCCRDGWTHRRLLPWIGITHVCRYWRGVALDCATIWTDTSYLDPKRMEVFLARSQNAPLRVRVATRGDWIAFTEAFAKALAQTHRLHLIDLEVKSAAKLHSLLAKMDGSAPILEVIFLECEHGSHTLPQDAKFLQDGTPSLKQISFQRCGIPWSKVPTSSGLIFLQLWNAQESHSQCRPSTDAFLNALESMPLLKHIDLFLFLPRSDGSPPRRPRLSLQKLSDRLVIYDFADAIASFFEAVEIPRAVHTDLGFVDTVESPEAVRSALSSIRSSWAGDMARLYKENGLQKLQVEPFPDEDHELYMIRFNLSFNIGPWSYDTPSLILAFSEGSSTMAVLLELSQGLDFSSLQALDIDHVDEPFFEAHLWETVLTDLPKLERASFQSSIIDGFVAGWQESTISSSPSFPKLATLVFSEVAWDETLAGEMAELLGDRARHPGIGPVEIRIEGSCDLDSFDLLNDAAANVKVTWDGLQEEVIKRECMESESESDYDEDVGSDVEEFLAYCRCK